MQRSTAPLDPSPETPADGPPTGPASPARAAPLSRARRAFALAVAIYLCVVTLAGCASATRNMRWDETRRAEQPTEAVLDHAQMIEDLRQLSSPELEGRRTGSAGAQRAQQYVAHAFEQAGLRALGPSFIVPFEFKDRSARALWEGGRPYGAHYRAANVVGVVPGRLGPGDTLVVSAHLDHLGVQRGRTYCGADDNASGVAAMLGLARWFAAHPPQHTVIFAAFDGEELGRHGALAFLDALAFMRERLRFDLNLDMVGRSDAGDVVAVGTYRFPALKPYVRDVARRTAVPVRMGHDSPFGFFVGALDWTKASDQVVFANAGIPFIYLGVENHRDYHTPDDTFDRIDQRFFAAVAEVARDLLELVDTRLDGADLRPHGR